MHEDYEFDMRRSYIFNSKAEKTGWEGEGETEKEGRYLPDAGLRISWAQEKTQRK